MRIVASHFIHSLVGTWALGAVDSGEPVLYEHGISTRMSIMTDGIGSVGAGYPLLLYHSAVSGASVDDSLISGNAFHFTLSWNVGSTSFEEMPPGTLLVKS